MGYRTAGGIQKIKKQNCRIAEDIVLALPTDDGKFRLEANASEGATGAVLEQEQEGEWHPIAFMSHCVIYRAEWTKDQRTEDRRFQ